MGFGGKSALRVWTKLQDCASIFFFFVIMTNSLPKGI